MPVELLEGASLLPFTSAEHVGSINSLASTYGQLNADGMFPVQGLDTEFVAIALVGGVIRALPVTPGGRPATIAAHDATAERIFRIPNVTHEDSILALDVRRMLAQARRSADPDNTLAALIERRHQKNRRKFDLTTELMKISALKGQIIDGAGTLLYDLFEVFGVTKSYVYFDLADQNFNVVAALEAVAGLIEDALTDEVMDRIEARISPNFFDALVSHPSFIKYYLNTPGAQELLAFSRTRVTGPNGERGAYRREFQAGPVNLIEYRGRIPMWNGTNPKPVPDDRAYAYPGGTLDTHHTYAAPPIDLAALNGTAADEADLIHMTTEPMKHGRGEEWAYQMNALPIWSRPNLTVEMVMGPHP